MIKEVPKLEHLPVYVRAGTILPSQPLVQSTAETPSGPLKLDVYPGADCAGTLYLDDGHSMAFQRGAFLRQSIRCEKTASGALKIVFAPREGSYAPWWQTLSVAVHGMHAQTKVSDRGKALAATYDAAAQTLSFTWRYAPGRSELVIGDAE
jgi:alpha-glucosidase